MGDETFPVLAFGHGGYIEPQYYGYLWVAPDSAYSGFGIKDDLAQDLAFAVRQVRADAGIPAGAELVLSGHSGGADSCIVAAGQYIDDSDGLVALAPMAPGDWRGGDFGMQGNLAEVDTSVPLLLQGASPSKYFVCGYGPDDSQMPLYNSDEDAECRAFVEIVDGNHCQYAQDDGCASCENTFSLSFCNDPDAILPEEAQHTAVIDLTLPWLENVMKTGSSADIAEWQAAIEADARFENVLVDC